MRSRLQTFGSVPLGLLFLALCWGPLGCSGEDGSDAPTAGDAPEVREAAVDWGRSAVANHNKSSAKKQHGRPRWSHDPAVKAGDLNGDGVIDAADMDAYATEILRQDASSMDWCTWVRRPPRDADAARLRNFVRDAVACGAERDLLAVVNELKTPTRLAWGPDGQLYVSDTHVGSVFIYAFDGVQLVVVGELKGISSPVGVGVDAAGDMFVGSDGNDRVEVYDPQGRLLSLIGVGEIAMPTSLAWDSAGNLYVADGGEHRVHVFDPAGGPLATLGAGMLAFPSSISVGATSVGGEQELFVASQRHYKIKVFSLDGRYLRSVGAEVTKSTFSWSMFGGMGMGMGMGGGGYDFSGKFALLQAVRVDGSGRVHALDGKQHSVQIFDGQTGTLVGNYRDLGAWDLAPSIPVDFALRSDGVGVAAGIGDGELKLFTLATVP